MRSVNKVILIGNLTRDPEIKSTTNGQAIASFGLATNREWITKDGQKQISAEFHELIAWAKLAEICEKNLRKGKLVYVEGYLKTRRFDMPDGGKKYRTEVVVEDLVILDKKSQEAMLADSENSDAMSDDLSSNDSISNDSSFDNLIDADLNL